MVRVEVCDDEGNVVTSQIVALAAAEGHVGKEGLVMVLELVGFEASEEELEELLLFEAGSKVLDLGVVQEELW